MAQKGNYTVKILECSLRDGGYYTSWDFSESLVDDYLRSMERMPVEYIEVGYRSKLKEEYAGAFYYLPLPVLKRIKGKTTKKLAVILNEKEINRDDLEILLGPCRGLITLVRLAVDPKNLERAVRLSKSIKEMGFSVSFNLMYASKWTENMADRLEEISTAADYFYVVDSYGGLYPQTVEKIFIELRKKLEIPLGFHGHNNLEMALANSLTAIEFGAEIIDSTVLGMGRGAGNLKTELILTVLNNKNALPIDFDALNDLTTLFTPLKERFKWGNNLYFMVSGAFSLGQDSVVSRVKKRFYSLNAIVAEVSDGKVSKNTRNNLPFFEQEGTVEKVLIVGGGDSPDFYRPVLLDFLLKHPEVNIIFASSKNVPVFSGLPNRQFHCIAGNEGKRLEKVINKNTSNHILILPPKNISEYNYIPSGFPFQIFQLQNFHGENIQQASATEFALQISKALGAHTIFLSGYDGYEGAATKEELELFNENNSIFANICGEQNLKSLTPTRYSVQVKSIYTLL